MKKKFAVILSVLLVFVCLLNSCQPSDSLDEAASEEKYQEARELLANGDLAKAYKLFTELGDYKDAKKEAARFHFVPTKTVFKSTKKYSGN